MTRFKRYAVCLLVGGLALALATPGYVAYAAPHVAGYLLHPALFLGQCVPYALCAALWLPWRTAETGPIALTLSALLFLAAVVLYIPILRTPDRGGDMIGLAYVAISAGTTVVLLLGSAVGLLVLWRLRARRGKVIEGIP